MKSSFIIILIVLFGYSTTAQTVEGEYNKIAEAYDKAEQIGFRMDIELYASANSQKIVETQSISVRQSGNLAFNQMGQLITITSKKHQLLIDHEHELLVLGPRPKVVKSNKPLDLDLGTEQLKAILDKEDFADIVPEMSLTTSGNLKGIQIDFKSHARYEQVIIWYDSKYMIKYVEMQCAEALPIESQDNPQKPRMVIRFNDYNDSTPSQKWFDLSPYVTISKREVKKTAKYSGYTLLNNTQLASE